MSDPEDINAEYITTSQQADWIADIESDQQKVIDISKAIGVLLMSLRNFEFNNDEVQTDDFKRLKDGIEESLSEFNFTSQGTLATEMAEAQSADVR